MLHVLMGGEGSRRKEVVSLCVLNNATTSEIDTSLFVGSVGCV